MRYVLTISVLVLMLAISSFGQDATGVKGKMMASGYAGYSLGFGDAFEDYSSSYMEYSTSAGLNFGGMFHYGLNDKLFLGGELGWQQYKCEGSSSVVGYDFDESSSEMNILANLLYVMKYEDQQAFYLTFGGGLYGGNDSEIGVFGGIMYTKKFGETLNGFFMPRFHMVFSDPSIMILSLSAGVSMPIGDK